MGKAFVVVAYGRKEVKPTQSGWEGTSASFSVGKISLVMCPLNR